MTHSAPPTEEPNPARDPLPLQGKVAVVTGASRRDGIGYATARHLAAYGASLMLHHYRPHDDAQPWGGDDIEAVADGVRAALGGPDARVAHTEADMADPKAPHRVMDAAVAEFGHVDILVANHARSGGDTAGSPTSPPPCSTAIGQSMPARPYSWLRRSRHSTTGAPTAGCCS